MKYRYPMTRKNWANYYIHLFNKMSTNAMLLRGPQIVPCEHMAMWYLILAEAEREGDL